MRDKFKRELKDNSQNISNITQDMLEYIIRLENTIYWLKSDRDMLETFLPKHGEVWEKLPTSCGACSVGWSLGNGIHRVNKHSNMDYGTLHQILHGSLRKI